MIEAAIREPIDVPERPIYSSDVDRLTELDASNRGIADLTGLDSCTGLAVLFLGADQISDISPWPASSTSQLWSSGLTR